MLIECWWGCYELCMKFLGWKMFVMKQFTSSEARDDTDSSLPREITINHVFLLIHIVHEEKTTIVWWQLHDTRLVSQIHCNWSAVSSQTSHHHHFLPEFFFSLSPKVCQFSKFPNFRTQEALWILRPHTSINLCSCISKVEKSCRNCIRHSL